MNKILKPKIEFTEQSRKIGITRRSISGLYPFKGEDTVAFESTLERDFLVRLETIRSVTEVISQPYTIRYKSTSGRYHPYTPDYLVKYKNHPWPYTPPKLIEVKPRELIKEQLIKFKPKYQATFQFCRENGFIFHFMDESKIRDQRLNNANFLRRYKKLEFNEQDSDWVLSSIRQFGSMTFDHLLTKHFIGERRRAIGISNLWHLIAIEKLQCNLAEPLNFRTELWESSYE